MANTCKGRASFGFATNFGVIKTPHESPPALLVSVAENISCDDPGHLATYYHQRNYASTAPFPLAVTAPTETPSVTAKQSVSAGDNGQRKTLNRAEPLFLSANSVKLPPDQSQRIVKRPGSFLFLSVADDPVPFGGASEYSDFSAVSNVNIFSESISLLPNNLSSPNGISISCNDILVSTPAAINTTGKDGTDQSPAGTPASNGAPAGPLTFYIQSGSGQASQNLSFVANGGDGGDATVANGKAGDGGDGGKIVRIFQSKCSTLLDSIYEFLARADVAKDNYNSPLRKGDTVYTAASNLPIIALKYTSGEAEIDQLIQPLRDLLSSIDSGASHIVHDLVSTVKRLRNPINELLDKQKRSFASTVDYRGGYPGAGKGVSGITGHYGKPGSDTYWFLRQYDSTIRQTTFAFAHPEQCSMLLERAKVFYYMGSPQLRVQAEILLQRVMSRLSFLPLAPGDPLYQAYQKSSVMPSDSLSRLDSIKTAATNWYMQLISGAGYNGHENNWVPRASYTFYRDALDRGINDLASFEDAYIKYYAALEKEQELQDAVGLALQKTSQLVTSLNEDIDDLFAALQDADNKIAALTDPVVVSHRVLMDEFERLKNKIRNDFELSLPQLVNALRSLAFSPNKAMAGVEGLDLAYQGLTSVPDLDGRPVNKKYIIGKIDYGEATVKSIKDTLGKQLDGTFELDDSFGPRLMTVEEDMMSFLASYANSSFANVINEMKSKFDDFIKAITARNDQVLRYNVQVKLLVQKFADRKDYQNKETELKGKKITINDPNLSAITSYMGDIYQSSRARVMKLLDCLVRSLNFRMLTHNDIYKLAFSGASNDQVPLTLTSDVLRSARSTIEDEFNNAINIWGSEPARFPQNFDNPRGKRIFLQRDELEDLIENKKVVVTIPPVYKETLKKTEFTGCCNIRVYRVRFGLTGLVAKKQANVAVKLTHSGKEIIVGRDNASYEFIHDEVKCRYSFVLYPDGTSTVLDDGNIGEADVDAPATHYAAPGPFPVDWEIDLHDSQLVHLDFSKVTEAYFDFCGTNYAF